jgi:hypothetical protein
MVTGGADEGKRGRQGLSEDIAPPVERCAELAR